MIDTPEALNIKDLTFEKPTPSPEFVFDPQRDIPEHAWALMRRGFSKAIDKLSLRTDKTQAIRIASEMKLLSGTDSDQHLQWRDRDWDNLAFFLRSGYFVDSAKILKGTHLFQPERLREEPFKTTAERLPIFNTSSIPELAVESYFDYIAAIAMLHPEKHFTADEDRLIQLQEEMDDFKSSNIENLPTKADRRAKIWSMINTVKLTDPERAKDFSIQIPLRENEIKKELDALSRITDPRHLDAYSFYASQLILFQAEKIIPTEQGLELVMPRSEADLKENSELPEMRKF